jgi:hypothetical protein
MSEGMKSFIGEVARQVWAITRTFPHRELVGGVDARLSDSEIREWDAYCRATPDYKRYRDASLNYEISMARIQGGDLGDEAEERVRAATNEYREANSAMHLAASKWYAELCERDPRPGF